MNERIRELAKEAGLKVNPDGEIGPAFFGSVDAGYRKFAELIVRECASACESATKEGEPLHLVSLGYSQRVKEHFGVE